MAIRVTGTRMPGRTTSPAVVIGALLAVLVASLGIGWLIAGRLGHPAHPSLLAQMQSAEPTYDAPDPSDAVTRAQTPPGDGVPQASAVPPTTTVSSQTSRPQPHQQTSTPADPTTPGTPSTTTPPFAPPAPSTRPAPRPPRPTPPERTAPATLAQYLPPATVTAEEDALPSEGTAWRELVALRNRTASTSQERADIEWVIDVARLAAAPNAPRGRKATARRALRMNVWWYRQHRSPTERVIARDPDGVLLTYRTGHGFMVNPVATMGRWRNLNVQWDAPALADTIEGLLVTREWQGSQWAALEYYDVPGNPTAVTPGVSGMAQARAANLFARAWQMTRDPRYAAAAARVLGAFHVPVDAGGVLSIVRDSDTGRTGPWYPERAYPGRDPWTGGALNGFMASLLGLRGAADAFAHVPDVTPTSTTPGSPATGANVAQPVAPAPGGVEQAAAASALARGAAERGVQSLVAFLLLHDSTQWSYYGLLTPGKPWRTYLADLNYHCYHVALLRGLDPLYPGRGLLGVADRWQGYVDQRRATCPTR